VVLNSFNQNPSPLYVLNGVVVRTIDSLSPAKIETIFVLKGQKATDKYGQKGKHGVVEIVTKNK